MKRKEKKSRADLVVGPGKSEARALAAGESGSPVPHLCLVCCRQRRQVRIKAARLQHSGVP